MHVFLSPLCFCRTYPHLPSQYWAWPSVAPVITERINEIILVCGASCSHLAGIDSLRLNGACMAQYLKEWWLIIYWHITASLGIDELILGHWKGIVVHNCTQLQNIIVDNALDCSRDDECDAKRVVIFHYIVSCHSCHLWRHAKNIPNGVLEA